MATASASSAAENTAPWFEPWTPYEGGGGIYLLGSEAVLYDDGFLNQNLDDYRAFLTFERIQRLLFEVKKASLTLQEHEIAQACLRRTLTQENGVRKKLEWYLHNLGEPDLGGVQNEPDFFGEGL